MTRPRKNPGASGIRTRDLPLSRRTPYQYLEGSEGMLPWNILKVETKICAIGGILGANLKKSGTLTFVMNISFLPSVCIHRSIILTFTEKKYACRFFFTRKIFCSRIFDVHFRENPRFREEFQALAPGATSGSQGGRNTTRPQRRSGVYHCGVCWLLAGLTFQQHVSASQGRIAQTILRAATLR